MYRHLLVPTDGSELSDAAVVQAAYLAKALQARMTLLYVQRDIPKPPIGNGFMVGEYRDDFIRESATHAAKILDQAVLEAERRGLTCEKRTTMGEHPWEQIVAMAAEEGRDLIFMASHGRSGLAGLIIGSETQKVLTHCKPPVLVYR